MLPLWAWVDLGAIAMKGYSAFPEPHHQIVLCHISRTLVVGVLLICRSAVSVFDSPCQLDHWTLIKGVLTLCRDAVDVFYSPPPANWANSKHDIIISYPKSVLWFKCACVNMMNLVIYIHVYVFSQSLH